MISLLISSLILVLLTWFFRHPFFERKVLLSETVSEVDFLWPSDGIIIYSRYSMENSNTISIHIEKNEDVHTLNVEGDYFHVGVYMSPFDRHFVIAPCDCIVEKITHFKTDVNYPMLDYLEYIKMTLFRRIPKINRIYLWLDKKHKYLQRNEKVIFQLRRDTFVFYVILIGDKFVNKIDLFVSEGQRLEVGDCLGFIGRGSQVDVAWPFGVLSVNPRAICEGQTVRAARVLGRILDVQ